MLIIMMSETTSYPTSECWGARWILWTVWIIMLSLPHFVSSFMLLQVFCGQSHRTYLFTLSHEKYSIRSGMIVWSLSFENHPSSNKTNSTKDRNKVLLGLEYCSSYSYLNFWQLKEPLKLYLNPWIIKIRQWQTACAIKINIY